MNNSVPNIHPTSQPSFHHSLYHLSALWSQTFIALFALLFILLVIIPVHSFPNIHPLFGLLFILLFIIQEISGPMGLSPVKKYQVERRPTTPLPSFAPPPPPFCPFFFLFFWGGWSFYFGNIPLWKCFAASSFIDLGYYEPLGFWKLAFFFSFFFLFLNFL